MNTSLSLRCRTVTRLQAPAAMLIALLQRTPAVRVITAAEEIVTASPLGALLRSSVAAAAALGGMHTLAGATVLAASRQAPTVNVNTPIDAIGFTVTDTINIGSWKIGGSLPPGLSIIATQNPAIALSGPGMLDATTMGADPNDPYGGGAVGNATTTPLLQGTPTTPGTYTFTLQAFEFGAWSGLASNTFSYTITVAGSAAPTPPNVSTQPSSQAAIAGASVSLNVAASGSPTIQWRRNGGDISGATNATLTLTNLQPANTGIYTALLTNTGGSTTSTAAIVGLTSTLKVIGTGSEVAANVVHPNGNTFDQVLIDGPAVAVNADAGQILRTSFIDKTNDIVQIEFSGAGTVSVVIDEASSPTPPVNYNQAVNYIKGHVGIVVTGANETTNMSVFSVGRGNAVNQALFKGDVTYDGLADVAYIAISSSNGKFGGLRTANANYFATKGFTGVYAPGVEFTGPVLIGDISAFDTATPVIIIGSSTNNDVRITGGDLDQANGRAVQINGFTKLQMAAGTTSHYVDASTPSQFFNAKSIRGRLELNGTDVTSQVVVNPTP
jgi:hypothetical protein